MRKPRAFNVVVSLTACLLVTFGLVSQSNAAEIARFSRDFSDDRFELPAALTPVVLTEINGTHYFDAYWRTVNTTTGTIPIALGERDTSGPYPASFVGGCVLSVVEDGGNIGVLIGDTVMLLTNNNGFVGATARALGPGSGQMICNNSVLQGFSVGADTA